MTKSGVSGSTFCIRCSATSTRFRCRQFKTASVVSVGTVRSCQTPCEVIPLTGSEQTECMTPLTPASGDGWCYISPEQGIGSAELVEHCPQDSQRTVRVIGAVTQLAGSELRLLCL
jgi:hypothetical protein